MIEVLRGDLGDPTCTFDGREVTADDRPGPVADQFQAGFPTDNEHKQSESKRVHRGLANRVPPTEAGQGWMRLSW